MLVGEDQRHLLPASAVFGALLLSAASVASKLIMPGTVFPIGIVTALIGVPFFGWLVLAAGRRREAAAPAASAFATGRRVAVDGVSLDARPGEVWPSSAPTGPASRRCCARWPACSPASGTIAWDGRAALPAHRLHAAGQRPRGRPDRVRGRPARPARLPRPPRGRAPTCSRRRHAHGRDSASPTSASRRDRRTQRRPAPACLAGAGAGGRPGRPAAGRADQRAGHRAPARCPRTAAYRDAPAG